MSSEKFIEAHSGKVGDISIYGQASNYTTWRLARMNLAIRGFDAQIAHGDTFHNDKHPGDLYLSLKDVTQSADLLGAVARLPIDHPRGRLTQDTVKLEPRGTNVPLDYLYWLLRTPQYRGYCRAHATGTTNLGLAVATLGALDDKIELNRRTNETLEAMARVLFKSWFVAALRDTLLPKLISGELRIKAAERVVGEVTERRIVIGECH